jgi:hypothetical protein
MKRIYIIVEGPTEEEFVYTVLRPYFASKGIYDIRAILIETSPGHIGGDLKYIRYKRNIENLLKRENDIIVTSLIDFFRLKTDFPKYTEAQTKGGKIERVTFLEQAISAEITDYRFLPYIQLHEFEGLLFSAENGFEYAGPLGEIDKARLVQAVHEHENPEMLNDGPETAPSKRLEKHIPRYRKPLHGPIMADEIGLTVIMQRCVRFRGWIEKLIVLAQ